MGEGTGATTLLLDEVESRFSPLPLFTPKGALGLGWVGLRSPPMASTVALGGGVLVTTEWW